MLYPNILGKSTFIIIGTYRLGNMAGRYQKSWGLKPNMWKEGIREVRSLNRQEEEEMNARFPGHQCNFYQLTTSCMLCPVAADC